MNIDVESRGYRISNQSRIIVIDLFEASGYLSEFNNGFMELELMYLLVHIHG